MEEDNTTVTDVDSQVVPNATTATDTSTNIQADDKSDGEDNLEASLEDALAEYDTKGELKKNTDSWQAPTRQTTDDNSGDDSSTETEEDTPGEDTPKDAKGTDEVAPQSTASNVEDDTSQDYSSIEDPGEFEPGDYSFDIKLSDGKNYKVKSIEDAEAIADLVDENPDLMTAKTLIEFNRNVNKMDLGIENDRQLHEARKSEYEEAQALIETRDNTILNINNGINYLEDKGLLPAVDPKLNGEDVLWEEHTSEPGVKERLELLKYMSDENERRISAGLEPNFDVVSAYNGMQLEKMRNQEVEQQAKSKETQRKAGAKVTGQSRSVQPNVKKDEIIGPGGSLDDLLAEYY